MCYSRLLAKETHVNEFIQRLDRSIAMYDLLNHPFYQAWNAGELSREDLRSYAEAYYPHVAAFPLYLAKLSLRLPEGKLRRAVLANMSDEDGGGVERPHSELWLDFAMGMGASRETERALVPEVRQLMDLFTRLSENGLPEEAIAAYYTYESQVARISAQKARGLREWYGADERTCEYFTVHANADIYHAQVWRTLLRDAIVRNPGLSECATCAAGKTAESLWQVLDAMQNRRTAELPVS